MNSCELGELPACPPAIREYEEIYRVVEDMPRFPGCEEEENKAEIKKCAESRLVNFINGNLEYPECARINGTEGTVVIQFTVEEDGSVRDCEVVRSLGDGCDHEALRIVNSFPTWIPGKQRGNPVVVRFTLPIEFKL